MSVPILPRQVTVHSGVRPKGEWTIRDERDGMQVALDRVDHLFGAPRPEGEAPAFPCASALSFDQRLMALLAVLPLPCRGLYFSLAKNSLSVTKLLRPGARWRGQQGGGKSALCSRGARPTIANLHSR